MRKRCKRGKSITGCDDLMRWLALELGDERVEHFGIVTLTAKHDIIKRLALFSGTIDRCTVHSRLIVERALEDNAAALALYHNHASGSAEPSLQDCDLTAKLKGLLEQLDIRLVDHIVVASGTYVSMAARELV